MTAPILDALEQVRAGLAQQDDAQVQQGHERFREAAAALVRAVLELDDRTLRWAIS